MDSYSPNNPERIFLKTSFDSAKSQCPYANTAGEDGEIQYLDDKRINISYSPVFLTDPNSLIDQKERKQISKRDGNFILENSGKNTAALYTEKKRDKKDVDLNNTKNYVNVKKISKQEEPIKNSVKSPLILIEEVAMNVGANNTVERPDSALNKRKTGTRDSLSNLSQGLGATVIQNKKNRVNFYLPREKAISEVVSKGACILRKESEHSDRLLIHTQSEHQTSIQNNSKDSETTRRLGIQSNLGNNENYQARTNLLSLDKPVTKAPPVHILQPLENTIQPENNVTINSLNSFVSTSQPKRFGSRLKSKSDAPPNISLYETVTKRRHLKTGYVYDIAMSYHATPDPFDIHPEDPRRILKIYTVLEKNGLLEECERIKSRKATREEITMAHSLAHYRQMKETSKYKEQEQYIESEELYDSMYLNSSSFESALYAAGSLIVLLEALLENRIKNAFAIIRPPGHHAEYNVPMGFCIFNNVAVATIYCMKKYNIKKTVIVDWDVHFGNGTQSIFSEDPNVLYISLHRYDNGNFYPADKKGAAEYTGEGNGKGATVNIPWSCSGMTDADYLYAFKEVVIPIIMEFGPELLIISAGFDAAVGDPIGECNVTPAGYAHMTHMLKSINNGKLAIALEGGYNLNSIALSALGCLNVLLGESPPTIQDGSIPKKECVETIKVVKEAQKKHWVCCS